MTEVMNEHKINSQNLLFDSTPEVLKKLFFKNLGITYSGLKKKCLSLNLNILEVMNPVKDQKEKEISCMFCFL